MNQDLSILHLIMGASAVVQAVVILLLIASVLSWAVMIQKSRSFKSKARLNNEFEDYFWSGTSLNDLYASASRNAKHGGPIERVFASGMREYQKLRERQVDDPARLVEGARRAMQASERRELDTAESGMAFLASVGSISPYVGLFGTVWGIMHAFTGFSSMEQITLATVAPGIAEALVATALGLFAAIPAVLAYNLYGRRFERLATRLDTFIEEFTNILQRNIGAGRSGSPTGR